MLAQIFLDAIGGWRAEVDVLVPADRRQRDAVVQLILACCWRDGEHDTFQLVTLLGRVVVEKS